MKNQWLKKLVEIKHQSSEIQSKSSVHRQNITVCCKMKIYLIIRQSFFLEIFLGGNFDDHFITEIKNVMRIESCSIKKFLFLISILNSF